MVFKNIKHKPRRRGGRKHFNKGKGNQFRRKMKEFRKRSAKLSYKIQKTGSAQNSDSDHKRHQRRHDSHHCLESILRSFHKILINITFIDDSVSNDIKDHNGDNDIGYVG